MLPKEKKVQPRRNISFAKREKFSQEEIQFFSRRKVQPRIDIGLTTRKKRFCQEKIERVGKGLVVSCLGLGFRLRGRSVEQVGQQGNQVGGQYGGQGWEKIGPEKKGQKSASKKIDCGRMMVNVG